MCGIAGVVGIALQAQQISEGLRSLEHRGPDTHGVYQDSEITLLHTRLSIIDLSAAARQPMKDDASGVIIAYNGEIYNYRELKAQLAGEPFITESDTEVILRLYLRHGMACVDLLRGMFAFAIWDPRTRTLHLCRDRFGIKPMYYWHSRNTFVFSSEIKGMAALGTPLTLNRRVVYEYLKYGRTADNPETFFSPVRSMEPGTILSLKEGQLHETSYWSPLTIMEDQETAGDVEEELWELLQETMRLHLVSDVPVGISLSSGLDSRFIVTLLSQMGHRDFHTFTWGYDEPEYDEIIRLENSGFPSSLTHHHLRCRPEEMLDSLERAVRYFELPLGGLGTLAAYEMMQLPHDFGIKVLLSGEGADETFGGYKYYYYSYFRDLYESGQTELLQRELQAFRRTNGEVLELGSADFQSKVLGETTSVRAPDGTTLGGRDFLGPDLAQWAAEDEAVANGPLELQQHGHLRGVMLRDLTEWKIPKLLWFQDRASMAWGIETRVPFLDHKLVEYMYRLPSNWIIRDGVSKYSLKRLLRRYGGVDHLDTVKHYVSAPQREWLKGPLYQAVNRYLDEGCLAQSGLLDYEGFKGAYAAYAQSPELGNSFFVWKMINLEALLREFFPK